MCVLIHALDITLSYITLSFIYKNLVYKKLSLKPPQKIRNYRASFFHGAEIQWWKQQNVNYKSKLKHLRRIEPILKYIHR